MSTAQKFLSLSSTDESAVRAVVSEFANTWNRYDMKQMHKLNTENVEWINITGNHWRGNATVYKGHDTIHRTIFSKTQMSVESAVVRGISADVVIAVATMKFGPVTAPTGEQILELKTRGSFTLVKTDSTWKIAHFHNTSIDPIAEQHDPVTWDDTGFLPGKQPSP